MMFVPIPMESDYTPEQNRKIRRRDKRFNWFFIKNFIKLKRIFLKEGK